MSQDDSSQYSIQENSCFFQGHKGQFFTRDWGISYKITSNNYDQNALEDINITRYKRILFDNLHKRIEKRNGDGGSILNPKDKDISIKHIKLVSGLSSNEICGFYDIYPTTAMCTESNCNQYFDIKKGKTCKHDNNTWDQIKFVLFCDRCGRDIQLQYGSNLGSDCKKCKEKKKNNTMTILHWKRKDDLMSYKVECKECHYRDNLIFYYCNHTDPINKNKLCTDNIKSSKPLPIATRLGTIIHPVVITIPDILDDQNELSINERKSMSENFSFYFPDMNESILNLPHLKELIINDSDFWKQNGVTGVINLLEILESKNFGPQSLKEIDGQLKLKKLVRNLLTIAKQKDNPKEQTVIDTFGLSNLERAMNKIPYRETLDEDWEGIFLSNLNEDSNSRINNQEAYIKNYGNIRLYTVRSKPSSIPEDQYKSFLIQNSIKRIKHIAGLKMIQALIGIIEGSTRNKVPLFNYILTGKKNHQSPTIYVRSFITEGIIFQLDYKAILNWFHFNQHLINPESTKLDTTGDPEIKYQEIIRSDERYKEAAYKLLHTISHMLIQCSTIYTGLDIQSLSEKIYPIVGSIFIYSTNNINVGGLESTFDSNITNWIDRMYDLASDCPQDPSCLIDENGACNACSYVPEFVCENFNQNIDRSCLIGNPGRFLKGFFHDHKSSS